MRRRILNVKVLFTKWMFWELINEQSFRCFNVHKETPGVSFNIIDDCVQVTSFIGFSPRIVLAKWSRRKKTFRNENRVGQTYRNGEKEASQSQHNNSKNSCAFYCVCCRIKCILYNKPLLHTHFRFKITNNSNNKIRKRIKWKETYIDPGTGFSLFSHSSIGLYLWNLVFRS